MLSYKRKFFKMQHINLWSKKFACSVSSPKQTSSVYIFCFNDTYVSFIQWGDDNVSFYCVCHFRSFKKKGKQRLTCWHNALVMCPCGPFVISNKSWGFSEQMVNWYCKIFQFSDLYVILPLETFMCIHVYKRALDKLVDA